MARDDPMMRFRAPPDLKAWLEESAARNQRSLNAEIVFLLSEAKQNSRDVAEAFSNDMRLDGSSGTRAFLSASSITMEELAELLLNRIRHGDMKLPDEK